MTDALAPSNSSALDAAEGGGAAPIVAIDFGPNSAVRHLRSIAGAMFIALVFGAVLRWVLLSMGYRTSGTALARMHRGQVDASYGHAFVRSPGRCRTLVALLAVGVLAFDLCISFGVLRINGVAYAPDLRNVNTVALCVYIMGMAATASYWRGQPGAMPPRYLLALNSYGAAVAYPNTALAMLATWVLDACHASRGGDVHVQAYLSMILVVLDLLAAMPPLRTADIVLPAATNAAAVAYAALYYGFDPQEADGEAPHNGSLPCIEGEGLRAFLVVVSLVAVPPCVLPLYACASSSLGPRGGDSQLFAEQRTARLPKSKRYHKTPTKNRAHDDEAEWPFDDSYRVVGRS